MPDAIQRRSAQLARPQAQTVEARHAPASRPEPADVHWDAVGVIVTRLLAIFIVVLFTAVMLAFAAWVGYEIGYAAALAT